MSSTYHTIYHNAISQKVDLSLMSQKIHPSLMTQESHDDVPILDSSQVNSSTSESDSSAYCRNS